MLAKLIKAMIGLIILLAVVIGVMASPLVGPKFVIEEGAVIRTSKAELWATLKAFDEYPRWNPYLVKIEGDFKVGETLAIDLVDGNFDGVTSVTATLTEIEENAYFCWQGYLLMPGIFDTQHCFTISALNDGISHIHQTESFGGLIAYALPAEDSMTPHVTASFIAMHNALIELF